MRNLAIAACLAVAVLGLTAAAPLPPGIDEVTLAQAKCGNDLCIGSSNTQLHVKGNIIADKPILSGTSGPVIIDGGVTIVGNVVLTGKIPTLRVDVLDAGQIFAQGTGPITRILPFTTAAIDFASATITCVDSAATTVTGARTGDACFVGMPSTLTAGGTGLHHTFTCYVSAADAVKIRGCATGTADDPGSVVYTGFVLSSAQ